jgi:hypothetical protein
VTVATTRQWYYHKILLTATLLIINLNSLVSLPFNKHTNKDGLRRTKARRVAILLDHYRLWRNRLGHWILSARFLCRGPGLVCGRRYFRRCKYCTLSDNDKPLLSTAVCVDRVGHKQEIFKKSFISQPSLFLLTSVTITNVRSYVYQTGRFTTETPSTGSSLFRIDDKSRPKYSNQQREGVVCKFFKFPDGISYLVYGNW